MLHSSLGSHIIVARVLLREARITAEAIARIRLPKPCVTKANTPSCPIFILIIYEHKKNDLKECNIITWSV